MLPLVRVQTLAVGLPEVDVSDKTIRIFSKRIQVRTQRFEPRVDGLCSTALYRSLSFELSHAYLASVNVMQSNGMPT